MRLTGTLLFFSPTVLSLSISVDHFRAASFDEASMRCGE